jgi:hypothetical protein
MLQLKKRTIVVILTLLAAVGSLLYPPWIEQMKSEPVQSDEQQFDLERTYEVTMPLEYAPVWRPPIDRLRISSDRCIINWFQILVEICPIVVCGMFCWVIVDQIERPRNSQN